MTLRLSPHVHNVPFSFRTSVWLVPVDTLDDATASFVFVTFTTNTPSLFVLGFVTVITALLYAPFSVGLNVPEVAAPSTYTTYI